MLRFSVGRSDEQKQQSDYKKDCIFHDSILRRFDTSILLMLR